MTGQEGLLTFLTTHKTLTRKQRAALASAQPSELPALAESMGMKVTTGVDIRPLIKQQLEEQRKTNQLLLMLIEALSEEGGNEDQEHQTYLDGTPA